MYIYVLHNYSIISEYLVLPYNIYLVLPCNIYLIYYELLLILAPVKK